MSVFVSRPMKIVTFLLKKRETPKRVVDFHRERDTFQNKIMEIVEIVEDFGVNPNFFIFLSFLIIFLHFFHFFICFIFFIFLIFSFLFISFFSFHCSSFFHFVSFSFTFCHVLSFSFSFSFLFSLFSSFFFFFFFFFFLSGAQILIFWEASISLPHLRPQFLPLFFPSFFFFLFLGSCSSFLSFLKNVFLYFVFSGISIRV